VCVITLLEIFMLYIISSLVERAGLCVFAGIAFCKTSYHGNLLNLLIQPVKNVDTMSNGKTSRKFPGTNDTPTDTLDSAGHVHFSSTISASNAATDDSQ